MKYANVYNSEYQNSSFDAGLRDYMYLIYKNMGISLLISSIVAFIVGTNITLLQFFYSNRLIAFLVQLAPIFFVFSINKEVFSGSVETARNKLYIFSALMGVSLSTIFVIYTRQNIYNVFLTASATFGAMSLYGYTTKKDLTSWSSFLYMGVMGIFIASLINIFVRSATVNLGVSIIGVLLFTLYTAYDVQSLKRLHTFVGITADSKDRIAIMGSLQLYMDFINLFLYMLRVMGSMSNRKE